MADKETEAEWEKSKRIEAERMKAARAAAEDKPDKSNLAYLDPKTTKVKGWSGDFDVIMASAERIGNRSLIFAIGGAVLDIIGMAGSTVATTYRLGLAGVLISGLPSGIGVFLMEVGILMAMVTIGSEIAFKLKHGIKFTVAIYSAIASILVIVFYAFVRMKITFG